MEAPKKIEDTYVEQPPKQHNFFVVIGKINNELHGIAAHSQQSGMAIVHQLNMTLLEAFPSGNMTTRDLRFLIKEMKEVEKYNKAYKK